VVSIVMTGIRKETSLLNVSKGGSTALYVDNGYIGADDNNDGYSWDAPFKSITGALAHAAPWMTIYIKPGNYPENVVIPCESLRLAGTQQDGPAVVNINPVSGTSLTCLYGYCEFQNLAFVSTNSHAIKLSGPGIQLHDCYIEANNSVGATAYGIWGFDVDSASIYNNYLNGKSSQFAVGVFLDSGSVDCGIQGNYFTDWGDAGKPGYCIGLNDAQRCAITPYEDGHGHYIPNRFISSYVGVYFYVIADFRGHDVHHNFFAENDDYDIWDGNDLTVSGISINENYYAYTGWFFDGNNDGRADYIISAYDNYDVLPLGGVQSWMNPPVPRINIL